jgi:hypothetical protein
MPISEWLSKPFPYRNKSDHHCDEEQDKERHRPMTVSTTKVVTQLWIRA